MHTDVVHVVWGWTSRIHVDARVAVAGHLAGDGAARDHDHVGAGGVGEGALDREGDEADVVAHLAPLVGHEGDLGAGEAGEDLVGAEGVEGGELGEDDDGDVHGAHCAGRRPVRNDTPLTICAIVAAMRARGVVTFPETTLLDVVGPTEVFHTANELAARRRAATSSVVASSAGGPVRASSGLVVDTRPSGRSTGRSTR